jgi:hypothetical protein
MGDIKLIFLSEEKKLTCFAVCLKDSSGSDRGSSPKTDKKLVVGSTVNTEPSETEKKKG